MVDTVEDEFCFISDSFISRLSRLLRAHGIFVHVSRERLLAHARLKLRLNEGNGVFDIRRLTCNKEWKKLDGNKQNLSRKASPTAQTGLVQIMQRKSNAKADVGTFSFPNATRQMGG